MDNDGMSMLGPNVDYMKIPSIHQKRTLAFINHFISNTVSMMNKFSRSCEMKLDKFEAQMQRLEASLCILETKLSSIPGLDDAIEVAVTPAEHTTNMPPSTPVSLINPTPISTINSDVEIQQAETHQESSSEEPPSQPAAAHDPRYARFFRMVHVGVPAQAVKLKMRAEGLDPDVLDNPNSIPPPPEPQNSTSSDSDSQGISE